jgi:hypothetical protein
MECAGSSGSQGSVQQENPIEQIFQPTAALLRSGFAKSIVS